ncbi:hypothetical protein V1523DRAFT_458114 [Lipomyces doorenjongii]
MHLQIGDKFADKQAFMFAMKDIAITEGYQYYPCSDARHIVIPAIPANSDEYEVRTKGGEIFPVYLGSHSCRCPRWDYCGVPCSHAVAVISFAGLDIIDFVEDHFKVDTFERTYAQEIHAMSAVNVTNDDTLRKVGPPNTRRPPGRPPINGIGPKKISGSLRKR